MPRTTSAAKALRQNIRRRKQNLLKKVAYKRAIKKYKRAVAARNAEEARATLSAVYKTLDKAAKTNVVSKNKAARLKSRLAAQLSR